MGNMPGAAGCKVSICIPSFGRDDTVARLCDILVKQNDPDTEIIIIAQGTRSSAYIHPRVHTHYLHQPNLPAARNMGINISSGDVILFLDDDCIPDGNIAGRHRDLHCKYTDHSAVAGQVHDRNNRGTRDTVIELNEQDGTFICDYGIDREEEVIAGPGGHISYKRSAITGLRYDPWFIGNAHFEEIDFALRLRKRGGTIMFSNRIAIRHLLEPHGGCRSEPTLPRFYYNQFHNRGLYYAKCMGIRYLGRFLSKQKHDLEYFSRYHDRHDRQLITASLFGLGAGLCRGLIRQRLGARCYR